MYRERFQFAIQHFCTSYALLIVLFWLIRINEFISIDYAGLLPSQPIDVLALGFIFDFWFCLVLSALTFPFYLLSYLFIGPVTRYFLATTFLFFLLIYLALVQYFVQTSIPLSSDFWGYSLNDIQTTINASATINLVTYLPFIIVLLLLFALYKRVQEIMLPNWVLLLFYTLSVCSAAAYIVKTPNASWFGSENNYVASVNKMAFFAEKSAVLYAERHHETIGSGSEYPLLHDADTADVLSPFFTSFKQRPNLVFVIVEGLGGTFVGPNARYGGCTPFLDSLSQHSLYWQNTLSTTGRTFGVLSSLLGSLPYNDKGFLETGSNMPTHLTLMSLLKQNGYSTRYFYGGNTNFDLQDVFLEKQGVDYILSSDKFPSTYQKLEANSEGFSWGYSDEDVFKRSLELFVVDTNQPTLSVYLTLNTHEPFKVPNQAKYLLLLDKVIAAKTISEQKVYKQFSSEFSSLLYTDDAIRKFINQYQKRSDYANTIFVITGDHRMIPVPQVNRLDRFHVPLIIFSPQLKRTQVFSSINTHHDVTPTFLSFLQHQTSMRFPSTVHWLGKMMDTTIGFHSTQDIALMRNKNELIDYINGNTFLSDGVVYRITPKLDLERLDNNAPEANILQNKMDAFKRINNYVFTNNKIYNDSLKAIEQQEFMFTGKEKYTLYFMGVKQMNPEQMFNAAIQRVQVKQYDNARLICKWCLITSPNFTDIRLVLGRTYAWEGNYDEAHKQFAESVKRSPLNGEAWRTLIDNELVFDRFEKAIEYAQQAYALIPKSDYTDRIILARKALKKNNSLTRK